MTPFAIFRTLQLISAACWLWCLYRKSGSAVRVMRGTSVGDDATRFVIFFVALDQLGYILRWFAFPRAIDVMGNDELGWWAGLYVLSGMCALGFSWVRREGRGDAR